MPPLPCSTLIVGLLTIAVGEAAPGLSRGCLCSQIMFSTASIDAARGPGPLNYTEPFAFPTALPQPTSSWQTWCRTYHCPWWAVTSGTVAVGSGLLHSCLPA
jgi:hypothetical protein